METKKLTIELCMGSSCYSRGNGTNVDIIEAMIADQSLHDKVELKGRLCSKQCAEGPCITINGTSFTKVRPDGVKKLVQNHIQEKLYAKA